MNKNADAILSLSINAVSDAIDFQEYVSSVVKSNIAVVPSLLIKVLPSVSVFPSSHSSYPSFIPSPQTGSSSIHFLSLHPS